MLHLEDGGRLEIAGREPATWTTPVTVRVANLSTADGPFVREDRGERETYLLKPDVGRLYRLDHEHRVYQEYSTPVRLEDYLPPGALQWVELFLGEGELARVGRTDGDGDAGVLRRLILEGTLGEYGITARASLASRDDLPTDAYLDFLRNVAALNLAQRLWSPRLVDEGLFPLRVEQRLRDRDYDRTQTRRFLSSTTETLAADEAERRFAVPEGYAPAPPYCLPDFVIGSDPACRRLFDTDRSPGSTHGTRGSAP